MSYFSFSLFVSILISFFLLFCKTNEIRWMSSEFFKQNNENFVSKIKQNQFFNFVTNNSLNSNAMYFLIFRLKQSKKHSIKFFESNSIFNVEVWIRELKKEINNWNNWKIIKFWYVIHFEFFIKISKSTLYCVSNNDCFENDVVVLIFCLKICFKKSKMIISIRHECVSISH